ncbi:helix-turn-helix domain-containing protein [Lactococcus garvieae]|uniref:helix-turn-helix domain-containing protein n=1 Tax=Lactococcus garvieae TaxID=1363 RepID=UPI0023ECFD77|nr:helix-turn-helix transcriptional regulator [Lactococcus garvieae]
MLDITQGTYALWEKKTSNPALEMMTKLADIYNTPIDIIRGRESLWRLTGKKL